MNKQMLSIKKLDVLIRNADKSAGLRHIWNIYPHWKCPLIGLCLSLDEHKRILKRTGRQIKGLSHYELHRRIMIHLDEENDLSLKVDRVLAHKYRADLSELSGLNEEDFMARWRERFRTGRMDGAFYVAAVRCNLSQESLSEIYGEVHMAGHANSAELMRAKRDLDLQTEAHRKTAKLLSREKHRGRTLRSEIGSLKTALSETRNVLKKHQAPVCSEPVRQGMEKLETENQALRDKLRQIKKRKKQQEDQLRLLEGEKQRLQIELFYLNSTNQRLAEETNTLIAQISSFFECPERCDNPCPKVQLCAKRILIVGGITRMKHLYRELVESSGGEFDYHDGYMKNGKKKLEAQVCRSDLILCPVNCNSHGACHQVKTICKKFNKPLKMLPESSLSMISSALVESGTETLSAC